jgi:choline dehydrogenase
MKSFDYVIAGGGTAACVVAHRMAMAGHSVCVLEAGPPDTNPFIRIPAGYMKTLTNPTLTWQMSYQASEGTNGRTIPFILGKTLGGSSAVNGAIFNRGQSGDFDGWAALGNPGWSYAEVLPYFRKLESFMSGGSDEFRGRKGPVPVTRTSWKSDVCDAFIAGAVRLGIPRNDDYNGQAQDGVGFSQSNIHKGRRWSAAHAYLHPIAKNPGVAILTHATVSRILFEGRRAVGVQYLRGDGSEAMEVRANRSVIVSAGAIHSPKILQLSGVGPAALLQQHGIQVVHDAPGVGKNLRDHFTPRLVARARPGVDSLNNRARGLRLLKEIGAWCLGMPSVLDLSPLLVYGFWKSAATLPSPDFVFTFTPGSYKAGVMGHLDDFPGVTCGTYQLRPQSSGTMQIASADVRTHPILQPNFLSSEHDRRVLVEALKWARKLLTTEAMKAIVETEILPGSHVNTDDEWLHFARQNGVRAHHPVGTCKMGAASDPLSVVDHRLKVRGLEGLRVVDASVMPTLPSANTCASTLMLAEKAADMILAAD